MRRQYKALKWAVRIRIKRKNKKMADKNSFVLQSRMGAVVAKLSDKQAGALFKAIFEYAENGTLVNFDDGMVDIAFTMFRQDIDYTNAKYQETCEKRKEAVQKRWENTKDTNVYKCIPCNTKNTNVKKPIHNDTDTDNDVDISISKEKESKEKESPVKRFVKPTVKEIKDYCIERNNTVEAQSFYDFYESKGWKIGNSPMKDWKAAIRTWEQRKGGQNAGTDYNGKDANLGKYEGFGRKIL